jgi:hypothetical protein
MAQAQQITLINSTAATEAVVVVRVLVDLLGLQQEERQHLVKATLEETHKLAEEMAVVVVVLGLLAEMVFQNIRAALAE